MLAGLLAVLLAVRRAPAQQADDPFAGGGAAGANAQQGVIANAEFVGTDVTTVFKMVSDLTGWSVVMSPSISEKPPKINMWVKNLSPEQVLDRVGTLAGLVIDRKRNIVSVTTFDEYAKQHGVEQRVITLKNVRASNLASSLQNFVPKEQAKVLAEEQSNKLILLVPDPLMGSLVKLIESLDVPFEKDRIRVVPLKHLDAALIGRKLERFLTSRNRDTGTTTIRPGDVPAAVPAAQGGAAAAPGAPALQGQPPAGAAGAAAAGETQSPRAGSQWLVEFMVESKLNVIVLRGLPADVAQAEELLKQLDVPPPVSVVAYPLRYTNATKVQRTLQDLLPGRQRGGGIGYGMSGGGGGGGDYYGGGDSGGSSDQNSEVRLKVAISEQNNEIIVEGSPEEQDRMRKVIAMIDRPLAAGSGGIRVYRLENSTAEEVAAVIQSVIEGRSGLASREPGGGPADSSQRGVDRAGAGGAAGGAMYRPGGGTGAGAAPSGPGPAAGGAAGAGAGTASASAAAGGPAAAGGVESGGGEVIAAQATAAPEINAVIIKASAAEQEEFAKLIRELDRPRDQVMMEVTIVNVRATNQFNLGVDVSAAHIGDSKQVIGFSTFGISRVNPLTGQLSFPVAPQVGGNFGVFKSDDFSLVLNALKTVGDVRITSTPKVLVEDNATAQIQQLNREPIVTVSQGQTSTLSGFGGYAEAGTTLAVVPHVSTEDWLRLEYEVNLSAFDQRTAEQRAANLPPAVRQNSNRGVVRVPSDYTVVLGGLASRSDQRVRQGIPLLSDLPLLGELFSSRTNTNTKDTLFIFIRPVLLRDPAYRDLRFLSETDIHRAKLWRRDFPMNPIKTFSLDREPDAGAAR
jgi:type II secretion system protein D